MTIEKSQCYVSWEDILFQDEAKFLKLVNDIFKQNSHPRFFVGKVLFALAEATLLIRVHREHAINIIDHEWTLRAICQPPLIRLILAFERVVSHGVLKFIYQAQKLYL